MLQYNGVSVSVCYKGTQVFRKCTVDTVQSLYSKTDYLLST